MSIISELFNDAKFIAKYRLEGTKTQKRADAKAPKAGDLAPDFTLFDILGTDSVTLSDFRGKKPVALVFGSYT
jgi:peroxiredoxin